MYVWDVPGLVLPPALMPLPSLLDQVHPDDHPQFAQDASELATAITLVARAMGESWDDELGFWFGIVPALGAGSDEHRPGGLVWALRMVAGGQHALCACEKQVLLVGLPATYVIDALGSAHAQPVGLAAREQLERAQAPPPSASAGEG